jgi:hypothetical protein
MVSTNYFNEKLTSTVVGPRYRWIYFISYWRQFSESCLSTANLTNLVSTANRPGHISTANLANLVSTANLTGHVSTANLVNLVSTANLTGFVSTAEYYELGFNCQLAESTISTNYFNAQLTSTVIGLGCYGVYISARLL